MTKAIPEGYTSVTPYAVFKDVRKAIEFYKRALGGEEQFAISGPDGKGIMHAEIRIGNATIMMGEENPQHGFKSAETSGGSPVGFYVYLENVDEAFKRALEAGAKALMPIQDMFWGDRTGTVEDPFGYKWTLATHVKDMTMEEIRQGAQGACAKME